MQMNALDGARSFHIPFDSDRAVSNLNTRLRQSSFVGIVSECQEMQRIFTIIEKVARTDSTVLVLGESGTGKELIACALHKLSGRKGKMVPVNCAAIPEEILESELFGHEKGAFTGASSSKIGRFQLADGGTIFLDEIAEMSPKLQAKLLRVLQERKVEPVGSTRYIEVNVRIIAATNKDLREEVEKGRFREDLFYRLQVVPAELPPLRERGADVSLLTEYFLTRACTKFNSGDVRLTDAAKQVLLAYHWPGNVRELENLIDRLVLLSEEGLIDISDLPDYVCNQQRELGLVGVAANIPAEGVDFNLLVDSFETNLIKLALSRTNWNKKAAAKLLNLNRTTLVEKIKKKGLDRQVEVIEEECQETDLSHQLLRSPEGGALSRC